MAVPKAALQLARQLFKLSFAEGNLSSERVAGVLAYVEKTRPAHAVAVLRAYQRLVAREVARSQAVVEHAGPLSPAVVDAIAAAMARRYGRPVAATAQPNAALLAGWRVRVGDDVYENSVAGHLAALASTL
jgi:F-type H+-transporting ATPase subunit delta